MKPLEGLRVLELSQAYRPVLRHGCWRVWGRILVNLNGRRSVTRPIHTEPERMCHTPTFQAEIVVKECAYGSF